MPADVPAPAQPPGELAAVRRLGQVGPPPPAVLAAARETLWAAVAAEMLASDPQPQPGPGAQAQREARRHQLRPPDPEA